MPPETVHDRPRIPVGSEGVEPSRLSAPPSEDGVAANYTTNPGTPFIAPERDPFSATKLSSRALPALCDPSDANQTDCVLPAGTEPALRD